MCGGLPELRAGESRYSRYLGETRVTSYSGTCAQETDVTVQSTHRSAALALGVSGGSGIAESAPYLGAPKRGRGWVAYTSQHQPCLS